MFSGLITYIIFILVAHSQSIFSMDMSTNYIKISRKLLLSKCWLDGPFSRGQAWVDLLLHANWKDKEVLINGTPTLIKRGQFVTSEVKLAKRWGWSRGKVRRYLCDLKTVQQIEQQTDRVKSIITICNYETYQTSGNDDGTTNGTTGSTTNGTQHKNIKNIRSNTHNNISSITTEKSATPPQPDNSPDAPKTLRRFKEPLVNRGGKVWLTDKQVEALTAKFTNEHEYRYWVMRLNDWAEDNPKTFNQRRSHYDTILNLRRMEIGRGKKWCYVEDTQEWQYVFVGYKNLVKQGA